MVNFGSVDSQEAAKKGGVNDEFSNKGSLITSKPPRKSLPKTDWIKFQNDNNKKYKATERMNNDTN